MGRHLAQHDPRARHASRWRIRPVCGHHDVRHRGLDRRSRAKRLFYEEMKALYAEALRIGEDLELVKAVAPEDRDVILAEKVDAMQRVLSELVLTGNFQAADLAIAYTYQQSVQLAAWSEEVETDVRRPDQFQIWLDNMTDEELAAWKKYRACEHHRREVVQALRTELALYVPRWSRYRRAMQQPISSQAVHLKRRSFIALADVHSQSTNLAGPSQGNRVNSSGPALAGTVAGCREQRHDYLADWRR